MGISVYGLSGLALVGFTGSGTPPRYCTIGSGSGGFVSTSSGLIAEYTNQRKIYSTRDPSTQKQCTWTYDWTSVQMSGLTLAEFGMFSASSGGTIWDRHTLGSVAFDGSIELQVQIQGKIS